MSKKNKNKGTPNLTSGLAPVKTKGTGAGGVNTNVHGKIFENFTSVEKILEDRGFIRIKIDKTKYGFYLTKKIGCYEIIYLTQSGLKKYFKKKHDIELFRNPDEAYLIKKVNSDGTYDKCIVKILEKKEQHCEGSVETKLWAGPSLKREYEIILGDMFVVNYAYCVNQFLTEKFDSKIEKYSILKKILKENNIEILHAHKKNYYKKLEKWVRSIY